MRFDVNFQNRRSIDFHIDNNLVSTTHIEVPVEEIIELLHDIASDFDMLKPKDRNALQIAIERIQGEYDA